MTTDKPLSPPGAIVCGPKNILIPILIDKHPIINPKASIIIPFDFFIIITHPP